MTDKDRKLIIVSWVILLAILCGFMLFVSLKLRTLQNEIQRISTSQAQPLQGLQGVQGLPGLPGLPGIPGVQGIQGEQGVAGVPGKDGADGKPGEKGDQGAMGPQGLPGKPGKPARELELCLLDGVLGQRFVGTSDCNPIEASE